MAEQENQAPSGLDSYFARDNAADAPVDSGQQSTAEAPAAEAPKGDQISASVPDRARDEAGRFAKADAPKAGEPPSPQAKPDPAVEGRVAAIKAEREGRQRAEAERDAVRRELEAFRRQASPQSAPKPAEAPKQFWDDPEGFITNLREEMRREVRQETLGNRLTISENTARARYADYQQMEDVFAQIAQREPSLRVKLAEHPDPAEFAYQTAKQVTQFQRMREDPASALDDAAFEKAAAARGYTKAPAAPVSPPPVSLPKGLADARSTRSAPAPNTGNRSLRDIFGR